MSGEMGLAIINKDKEEFGRMVGKCNAIIISETGEVHFQFEDDSELIVESSNLPVIIETT